MTRNQAFKLKIEFEAAHKAYMAGKLTSIQKKYLTMKHGHWFWKGFDMVYIYNLITK